MYRVFTAPDEEVSVYEDVILDGQTGILIDSTGKLIKEQADEALFWLPTTLSRSLRAGSTKEFEETRRTDFLKTRAQILHAERNALSRLDTDINYIYMMHPFGFFAFGHFFDSIQRLYQSLQIVPTPRKILHSDARRIVEFTTHMQKIGVHSDDLVCVSKRIAVRVPRLWISPWQEWPAKIHPEIFNWLYRAYTRSVSRTEPTRLYLSRNHVRAGERGVLNENTLLKLLDAHNFQILDGSESLETILSLFNNAEMIIAPHGSMLANTMFCQSHCRIIEFCPDNRKDLSFKLKIKKTQHYEQIFCSADNNYNIEIPLVVVREFLAKN